MGEWYETALGEILTVEHGYAFLGSEMSEDLTGRPIIVSIGNFSYSGGFRFAQTRVRELKGEAPPRFLLSPGDLLVVMTCQTPGGEILGLPGIVPNDGKMYLHNQRIGKVTCREGVLDPRFAYYLFLSDPVNRQLVSSASGTKILHTSPERIGAVRCHVPPLSDQRAIAEVLGALDDKIALNERIAETSLALGRSVFRQETQVAGVETTVGDLAALKYGKALPAPLRRPGFVPVFGCTGQVGFHDTALTQSAHPVVGRKGANAGHVSWLPEPGWIIDTAFYAMPKQKEVSNEVLYFVLDAAGISTLTADSAVPGVNRDVALRHHIRTPALGRLGELAPRAEAFLATCQQAARENRTLADLRDTLLPQLVTGKLRVKDAIRVVEEAV